MEFNKLSKLEELKEKRNLNSKHFLIGHTKDRKEVYQMDAHIGHIHYSDKQSHKLENVDCQFIPCDYGWEMRKNNYELEIPKKANDWFKFINSFGYDSRGKEQVNRLDEIVSIKPLGVSAVSGESITKPEWKGKGIVLYKNAYGADIDLEVMARNTGFVKEVIINKKPVDLSKDLEFAFEIDLGDKQVKLKKADYMNLRADKIKASKGLEGKELIAKQKLYEDDLEREVWNKTSKLETSESIILQKLRKTWFRKFNLYDSEGNQGSVKVRLENIDGKIILTKVLDKTFLENAVFPVRTDTTTSYYAGAGDGYVTQWSSIWNIVHDHTIGNAASSTGTSNLVSSYWDSGNYGIYRAFLPIDTSGLPDEAIISAADLNFYVNEENGVGTRSIALVQTDQPSNTTLTIDDYNNCGATNSPTEGATRKVITATGWVSWDLDATGLGWISKTGYTKLGIRSGHLDCDDTSPTDGNQETYMRFRATDYATTDYDPYLSVTYAVPPTPKSVSDSGSGADAISIKIKVGVTDTGAGADNTPSVLSKVGLQEIGQGAEVLAIKNALLVAEQGSGADIAAIKQFRELLDSGAGSETIGIKLVKPVVDSGVGQDLISAITAKLLLQETGTGQDLISAIKAKILLSDSGSGVDAISWKRVLSILETGTGADILNVLSQISIQESGAGQDLITAIKAKLLLTESGLGTDVIGIKSEIGIEDSGAGAEALDVLSKIAISEQGTGNDIIKLIVAKLLLQDTGAGADQVAITGIVDLIDSGAGVDVIAGILAKILIQEVGMGADRIKVPSYFTEKYSAQGDSYSEKYEKQNNFYQQKYL